MENVNNTIANSRDMVHITNDNIRHLVETAQCLNSCSLVVLQAFMYGKCDLREYEGAIRDIHNKIEDILGEAAAIERGFSDIHAKELTS